VNIAVCIKQVPDPNSPGHLDPITRLLLREGVELVLDPGDEVGIETGLRLAEAHGGTVRVVSMGPETTVDAIRKALAMGAANGTLVNDDALPGADALTTAKVLAAAIAREPFDLVITGTESSDGYTGIVPQALGELLSVPAVTFASTVNYNGQVLIAKRHTDVGTETIEVDLPCILSVTAGVNEPRYPSLRGVMGAKSKPIEWLTLADLCLSELGTKAPGQVVVSVEAVAERSHGVMYVDDGDGARRILDFLNLIRVI
jgi:electron transfer flavoprotein beta subunit